MDKNSPLSPYFAEKETGSTVGKLLYNAHAHLPGLKSQTLHPSGASTTSQGSFSQNDCIVNGTEPTDWLEVLQFAQNSPKTRPAIGLHPQKVDQAPRDWKETYLQLLKSNPTCCVGEIGLDRRYQNDHFKKQLDAFSWQLQQSHEQNRPVSIHCVKAIGLLMETLRNRDLPSRGIHLHAYAGPTELIHELAEKGAYFSFSVMQLRSLSAKIQDRIRSIPADRLLIETDTPYQKDASELLSCYTTIAGIREVSLDSLVESVEKNFKRFF